MTYNTTSTSTSLGNTGLQNFAGNLGKLKYIVLVPEGTEIATKVLAETIATWQGSLNAAMGSRWFCLPLVFNGEPTLEDTVKETSDFGYESLVRPGKMTYKVTFEEISVYNKNQLNKLNNGNWSMFEVTDKDWIKGYSADGIKFLPKKLDYFYILPETQNTGSANAHVQAEFRFTTTDESNLYEAAINPSLDDEAPVAWYPSVEIPAAAVKDLIVTLTGVTATAFGFSLYGYDSVAHSLAVKEDIYLRKSTEDGTLIPITSITETAVPGVYTGVIGTQTSGTFYLSLLPQPTAATQGFETPVVSSYAATIP